MEVIDVRYTDYVAQITYCDDDLCNKAGACIARENTTKKDFCECVEPYMGDNCEDRSSYCRYEDRCVDGSCLDYYSNFECRCYTAGGRFCSETGTKAKDGKS